jgi:hypothetical protein
MVFMSSSFNRPPHSPIVFRSIRITLRQMVPTAIVSYMSNLDSRLGLLAGLWSLVKR